MYDPYSVLGVARSASEDEVKHAFRTLAKRYHPDTPEGASDKGRRFKDLSIAYEILGDAGKRRAYDRGEIDAHGNPRAGYTPRPEPEPEEPLDLHEAHNDGPEPGYRNGNGNGNGHSSHHGYDAHGRATNGNGAQSAFRSAFERAFGGGGPSQPKSKSRVEDLFSEFFGDRSSGTRRQAQPKSTDNQYDLTITFEESALGGTRRVKLPDGKRFDVKIPIGVRNGQIIRLRGLGEPASGGGSAGDALITILIEPHPYFRREGQDILVDLPVTINEALHGARVKVPTLYGSVSMQIPEGANAGQMFRLKGKGLPAHAVHPAGDQLVTLQIVLPDQNDPNLSELIKGWEAAHPYDPRRKFGGNE